MLQCARNFICAIALVLKTPPSLPPLSTILNHPFLSTSKRCALSKKNTKKLLYHSLARSFFHAPVTNNNSIREWKRRSTSSVAITAPEELTNSRRRRSATATRSLASLSPSTTSSTSPMPTPLCPTVSSTMSPETQPTLPPSPPSTAATPPLPAATITTASPPPLSLAALPPTSNSPENSAFR